MSLTLKEANQIIEAAIAKAEEIGIADAPIYRGIVLAEGGHMILSKGALPIVRAQEIIGACGVGGGTADEDEVCAAAGLAAISG